ncbi:MAG: hypothetical protein AAF518_22325 [Spirochaetota bacterium]
MNRNIQRIIAYSTGVLVSLVYGFSCQLMVRKKFENEALIVMSYGFVFLLPFCLGIITVYFASERLQKSFLFQIFMPWVTSTCSMVISMLIGMEGTICLFMALPVYFFCSSLGGLLTGLYLRKNNNNRFNPVFLSLFLFTPIISGTIESKIPLPKEIRTVLTEIDIDANPEKIWQHITVIPKITEKQTGFFYLMGFPKPVEATLSFPGVGGVREAKFEKGLFFLETISKWVPNDELVFDIAADPEQTPLTTLDPHVVVGGHFFDTLEGRYKIIPLGNNRSKLLLSSRYRISTRFNIYARIWSDFLMSDIQNNILRVIKSRCEK